MRVQFFFGPPCMRIDNSLKFAGPLAGALFESVSKGCVIFEAK